MAYRLIHTSALDKLRTLWLREEVYARRSGGSFDKGVAAGIEFCMRTLDIKIKHHAFEVGNGKQE